MNSTYEALVFVLAMGAVILFCRVFPFLFFSGNKTFSNYVEKTVPPVVMTVLAFNALGASFRDNPRDGLLVLGAAIITGLLHIWKKNPLISIFGGTILYLLLRRLFFGN